MHDPRSTVRAFFDHINRKDLAGLAQLAPPSFAEPVTLLATAFPDIAYTLTDLIAEGDRVAVRWSWTCTHARQFRDFAPTNRRFTNTGMAIFTVAGGKITAVAMETDRLGFQDQARHFGQEGAA